MSHPPDLRAQVRRAQRAGLLPELPERFTKAELSILTLICNTLRAAEPSGRPSAFICRIYRSIGAGLPADYALIGCEGRPDEARSLAEKLSAFAPFLMPDDADQSRGECAVCGRFAPLDDRECPDCRH